MSNNDSALAKLSLEHKVNTIPQDWLALTETVVWQEATKRILALAFSMHRNLLASPASTGFRARCATCQTVTKRWAKTSSSQKADPLDVGRYGMRRVDYSTPPPRWPMPAHPPPPTGWRRWVFPVSLTMSLALFGWIYTHQEDDIQDYWRAVDAGQVPLGDDDDDDDDDEEDDEGNDDD